MTAVSTSNRATAGGRGRRGLSREVVVAAAIQIARRDGIDALSMRRVADELDSAPMSLYRHVADREALLLAMLDDVATALVLPPVHPDPTSELSVVLRAIHTALRHEPWLVHLLVVEGMASPAIMPAVERIFAALSRAGVPDEDIPAMYSLLWHYTEGEAMAAHHDRPDTLARRMFTAAVHEAPESFPVVLRVSSQTATNASRDYFERNVARLLRGAVSLGRPPHP